MANGYIGKINLGVSGSDYLIGSTAYAVCDTASATAAKTVSMPGFALMTGATIHVKFTYDNSVANPTLNVNSTGAKAMMDYGSTPIGANNSWNSGAMITFTYDGTYWIRDYTPEGGEVPDGYRAYYNTTISFSSDNTYADYPYRGQFINADINANMYAEVVFGLTEATSGNYAPICVTDNEVLYIYSKVNTSITVPTIIVFQEDGRFDPVLSKNFIYLGTTAPSDTTVIWIDTAHNSIAKVYNGASWITVAGAFA